MGTDFLINVWDLRSFDPELVAFLSDQEQSIRAFWNDGNRSRYGYAPSAYSGDPSFEAYERVRDGIAAMMSRRSVRAWHYTRLVDFELESILREGFRPMTLVLIRQRLDSLVERGILTEEQAGTLFADSPFHDPDSGSRNARIWFATEPSTIDGDIVVNLLDGWGGESVNFIHEVGPVHELLSRIGEPYIFELALPVGKTERVVELADCIAEAYAFAIGSVGSWAGGCDLVSAVAIGPECIEAVHKRGDPAFVEMGRGYPPNFEPGTYDPDAF